MTRETGIGDSDTCINWAFVSLRRSYCSWFTVGK